MTVRSILWLILIGIAMSTHVFAQKKNVQTANIYLRYNELDKAKEYIDLAYEDETTSNNFKMWYYRGQIYMEIHFDTTGFRELDKDAIEKATISLMNCIKTDTKEWYIEDCERWLMSCAVGLYNEGAAASNLSEADRAIRYFTLIFDIFQYDDDGTLKRNNITPDKLNYYSFFG